MTLAQLLGDKRRDILRIAAQHGAGNVRVAGTIHISRLRDAPDQVIALKYAGAEPVPPPVLLNTPPYVPA